MKFTKERLFWCLKILLTVFLCINFFFVALFSGYYYCRWLGVYDYVNDGAVIGTIIWAVVMLVSIAILVVLLVFLHRKTEKHKALKMLNLDILMLLLPISAFTAIYFLSMIVFGNTVGYSYTENVEHYQEIIESEENAIYTHFPDINDEDMEVVNFSHFFKVTDHGRYDVFLEVRFDDRETMERYVSQAISELGERYGKTYQNPYNSSYTDSVKEKYDIHWDFDHDDHCDIDAYYQGISYSYDDMTVLYVYTDIEGISTKEYLPKYLQYFGILCEPA